MPSNMNNPHGEQLPDMSTFSSLLGSLQDNKKIDTPANNKPKTYEEYKQEKEEKKKKEQNEKEYQDFKQSMQRAEKYLKTFDKTNLSNKKKKKIEDLKKWAKGGNDVTEKLKNVVYALDKFIDVVFSVALFGFAGVATERQIQHDKHNMAIILKNKMGIKLEGKEQKMFNRYQQEKQQETKEKEKKKKKEQKKDVNKQKTENKKETHIKDNKLSNNILTINTQNNGIPKVNNDTRAIQKNNEKTTFFDNLSALNEEKKQQAQQQKQEKEQEEKQSLKDTKQTLDNTNDKTTQENSEENTKFLSNETNDVEITDKQKIDIDKLLIKKQAQNEEMLNNIANQLDNAKKIDENNHENEEEKKSNNKNNDTLKENNNKETQHQKMIFNMEQKQINNTIPNNKQNNTKISLT